MPPRSLASLWCAARSFSGACVIMAGDDYQLWLPCGRGSLPQRPTDLLLSLEGHFKLCDKPGNLPLGFLAYVSFSHCLFLSDDGFLKACLCSRGFLKVSILESHLQRFLMSSTFSTITQYCSDSVNLGIVFQCEPCLLLSPPRNLNLLSAVLSWKEDKLEVMVNLVGNSASRSGVHKSPRGAMNALTKFVHKIWSVNTLFFSPGKCVHSFNHMFKASTIHSSLRNLDLRQNSNGFWNVCCLLNHRCLFFIM